MGEWGLLEIGRGELGGDCPVEPETDVLAGTRRGHPVGLILPYAPIECRVDTAPNGRYLPTSGGGGELQLPVGSWSSPPRGMMATS